MTIGRKIAAACSVLVTFSAMLGAVAALSIANIRDRLNYVVDDSLPAFM